MRPVGTNPASNFQLHKNFTTMQLVIDYEHKPATTSLLVAEKFGKRHDDVLRAIRNLECSEEFSLRNFTESNYSLRGKNYPMYIISRDGFTFLVMGFNGLSASKFKEEYIDQFNKMEAAIRETPPKLLPTYTERILSKPTRSKPKGYWTVFDRSHMVLLLIEAHIGSINKYDIVDGSIGRNWSLYRSRIGWTGTTGTYIHEFDDNRGGVECKCYKNDEQEEFDEWLEKVYVPEHLEKYLVTKYSGEKNQYMLERVHRLFPLLLAYTK
jgi:Rha family phage regulatory protein